LGVCKCCQRLECHDCLKQATEKTIWQQTYSAIDSEAYSLSQAFFVYAQSLIAEGPELVTLTTVSALQFLCIAAMGYGKDRLALQFLQQSVKIGTSMGLFGVVAEQETARTWLGDQEDWIRGASYTAWGVFNWVSSVFPKGAQITPACHSNMSR
jgi:hypothetical protein